jgi:hypothetical protein
MLPPNDSVTVPGAEGLPGVVSISGSATPLKAHRRNFATERFFCVAQYDGINDFVAFDLSGFLVGEFHSSAICQRFDPLVAHSAPHVAIQTT